MPGLREQFSESLKDAMRAKDQRRVSTLRLILAALKERDIAARTDGRDAGVPDSDILPMLQKMAKQRDESIAMYDQAGRADLATQEREEKAIIESYLPKQMAPEDVKAAAKKVIAELGAKGMKDMGRTITALKTRYAGQMDFAKASALVKEILSA